MTEQKVIPVVAQQPVVWRVRYCGQWMYFEDRANAEIYAQGDDNTEPLYAAQPPATPVETIEPVAYRVKDFADGWILCHTLEVAEHEADGQCLIQPLYAGPIPFSRPQSSAETSGQEG